MKVFFYIWCFMAACGLIATFFNPGHFFFSFVPASLMALAAYPEVKQAMEERRDEERLR